VVSAALIRRDTGADATHETLHAAACARLLTVNPVLGGVGMQLEAENKKRTLLFWLACALILVRIYEPLT
jgi:hypothetical protein